MKKNKKAPKENGIISIVQSPDDGKNNTVEVTESKSDKPKDHGIISIVQSPDDDKNRKNE